MDERFGFIHEKIDIKILILFITGRLPVPVTLDVLAELTLCDDGISYFDFTECVSELVGSEHLKLDSELYSITEKGLRNGKATEQKIPYTVRLKAEKSTSTLRTALSRDSMIKTDHTSRRDGGYNVSLKLSDGLGEFVSIELYAANAEQVAGFENGFRKKAEVIYNRLVEFLLDEDENA